MAKLPYKVNTALDRLLASTRGQIFLVNLHDALPMLDATPVREALESVDTRRTKKMPETSYLTYLRDRLQDPIHELVLLNERTCFTEFAPDGWIANVFSRDTFDSRYRDPKASISGHKAVLTHHPGEELIGIRPNVSTRDPFWIAPCSAVTPPTTLESDAETARDLLGLVHFRHNTALVSMRLKFAKPMKVYKPTVIEANPNARFRQRDPIDPAETRWGKTVNLSSLSVDPILKDLGGVPEMLSKVKLKDADESKFYDLGLTRTDQSTSSTDTAFLLHILDTRDISRIYEKIRDHLRR